MRTKGKPSASKSLKRPGQPIEHEGPRIYAWDRVRIICRRNAEELRKAIPVEELKKECHELNISEGSDSGKRRGYRGVIEVSAPTERLIRGLIKNQSLLGSYRITKVEVSEDRICKDRVEAIKEYESLAVKRKWSPIRFQYERGYKPVTEKEKVRGLFWVSTFYLGGERNTYRAYPRESKVNGKPAFHHEFQLLFRENIRKYAGIVTLEDLLSVSPKKVFQGLYERFIVNIEGWVLDFKKLARFSLGVRLNRRLKEKVEQREIRLIRTLFKASTGALIRSRRELWLKANHEIQDLHGLLNLLAAEKRAGTKKSLYLKLLKEKNILRLVDWDAVPGA